VLQQNIPKWRAGGPPGTYSHGRPSQREPGQRFWGFIPERILWACRSSLLVFYTPPDQLNATEMSDRVKFLVHIVVHFFDETRWNRNVRLPLIPITRLENLL